MAGGRGDRGLYDGRNVSGVRLWLEVGETEDSMVDALYVQKVNAVRASGWSDGYTRLITLWLGW